MQLILSVHLTTRHALNLYLTVLSLPCPPLLLVILLPYTMYSVSAHLVGGATADYWRAAALVA